MSDRMSLKTARSLTDEYNSDPGRMASARTIVAVGEVIDYIREFHPEMTREQYVFGDPVDREVNNTAQEILYLLEDALGVPDE